MNPVLWNVKTPWTLLLQAGSRQTQHLERLLEVYRQPVYAYYRAQRLSDEDAEDLTQSVLMTFFLVKKSHRQAEPARGRFRDYLLGAARNALRDWKKGAQAAKRGNPRARFSLEALQKSGRAWEPSVHASPEEEFERAWALATWRAALERLRTRHHPHLAEALDVFYAGDQELSHAVAAQALGISPAAFNSRLYTARVRFYACIVELVSATVEDPAELGAELARLRGLLAKHLE